ncbi:MAG: electron transport complex subunit RsxC [Treponemataceae bacterium]|nr:MAG: electron transport complex subunit RsxC [Treponemataceae bacterium]
MAEFSLAKTRGGTDAALDQINTFALEYRNMKAQTFRGGIHPPEKKELAESFSIETLSALPKTVTIPVTMGGAPNAPTVKVGDAVVRGQVIAEGTHPMSVPVHASVSGKVTKIEARNITGNVEAPCIIIETDAGDTTTKFLPPLDPFTCSKEDAVKRVREAGIVGMGGAGFPTGVKLNPPPGMNIEYVLANGAECEPYLTIDQRIMTETPKKVVDGVAIAMKITGAKEGKIALETNKVHLVEVLDKEIQSAGYAGKISVSLCKTKYPQGCEKNIVQSVLNREIPAGGLPASIGCLIQNISTLCAISDAFREGKPLIERGLTISGGACKTPKNLRVPIGTVVSDLENGTIEVASTTAKILSGGPMMGFAMQNAEFPVAKNTSGVLFLTKNEARIWEEGPCISCGKCVNVCPCSLTPVMIQRSLAGGDLDAALKFGLMDCMECGSCAYTCPAHVKLVQHFKVGKGELRARQAAELAKKAAKEAAEGAKK